MGEYSGLIFCDHFSNSICSYFSDEATGGEGECKYHNDVEASECIAYYCTEDNEEN